jgi:TRAP-type mannitol/chloroaromatic compound transport system substrate-binding protein
MQKLGVSVNILPGGEIFPALEKKVIDATEFSMPVIDENMGFHKLAKYNYFPGWHQQATAFELLINKDVWNNLSSTQQVIIEMACRDTIVHSIATGEASQAAVLQRNELEHGVEILDWQPEIMEAYREKWLEVVDEQSAADPFFKKVWDDFSDFRKQYATWGSKAYLPRSR